MFTFMGTGARFVAIGYKGPNAQPGTQGAMMKLNRHVRNLCLGAFMLGVGVYQGGVMGFVLGAVGMTLMVQSWLLLK